MPRLQNGFLANAATIDANGLVNVLGAFAEITTAHQLPIRQQLWLIARLELDETDIGTVVPTSVVVEHDDGTERLIRIDTVSDFRVPLLGADPDLPRGMQVVLPLALEFRRVGLYHVKLLMNGEVVLDRLLKVRQSFPTI